MDEDEFDDALLVGSAPTDSIGITTGEIITTWGESDTTSETGDITSETGDTTSETGDTTSETGDTTSETGGTTEAPAAPLLTLTYSQVKQFDFVWGATPGAEYYQLLESTADGEPYEQVGDDLFTKGVSLVMPLFARLDASYVLRACNEWGCTDSDVVEVMGTLAEAVGYFKASNTAASDYFGSCVELSGDGNTLAVGANWEDSNGVGINGSQNIKTADHSGAVYLFAFDGQSWSQQAYVKASNAGAGDDFGRNLSLSDDGNTLAVGAAGEDSSAKGINGNQASNAASTSGAVYVFTRSGAVWSQQAYVKASNTNSSDQFGMGLALSGDGNTLAVGANGERSNATGIGGNQLDNSLLSAGAVYVFTRSDAVWSQQAYVKASNTGGADYFGNSVSLSYDGDTLGVGAGYEDSGASGIDGNQADNSAIDAGAVYVFSRSGAVWSQQAYVKSFASDADDQFGIRLALSGSGDTMVVGALHDDSASAGIDGDPSDDSLTNSGAAYVYTRNGSVWSPQTYVKASNPDMHDRFGMMLALSNDGQTMVVGARWDSSNATGVGGNQLDNSVYGAGAAYVFVWDGTAWSQQAYVKAPNPDVNDFFGDWVSLSGNGSTLAVAACCEDGNATGIAGDHSNNQAAEAGAVYLY
ncbi:integrin [Nannocystaceae bacterium ST9]